MPQIEASLCLQACLHAGKMDMRKTSRHRVESIAERAGCRDAFNKMEMTNAFATQTPHQTALDTMVEVRVEEFEDEDASP
jgi:hypothetical protein